MESVFGSMLSIFPNLHEGITKFIDPFIIINRDLIPPNMFLL